MGMLSFLTSPNGNHAHSDEPRALLLDAASKLFLATCLLDRARREVLGSSQTSPDFDQCKAMLNEIRRMWAYREENRSLGAVDATYKINVLMTAIERFMGRLAAETGGYARLQQCINLLDEVDLILETFGVCQTASS